MDTETIEKVNNKSRLKETMETAGKVASVAIDAGVLKKRVENAVEDALIDARRMAKHSRHAIEDVIDDTTYLIKKNPWQSVGYVLGAGIGIGFLSGWLMTRKKGNSAH